MPADRLPSDDLQGAAIGCRCCSPVLRNLTRRMNAEASRRGFLLGAGASLVASGTGVASHAQQAAKPSAVLFENVRIFDGVSESLTPPSHVLVVGNLIRTISASPIKPPENLALTTIAAGGRTLMPGLIDAHTHIMFATLPQAAVLTSDLDFIAVAAVKEASDTLMRGFTTIRDMGGPCFGLKRGIDAGLAVGPRIWPSGAFISQTGGHGDFRLPNELPAAPGVFGHGERVGATAVAYDPGMVRKRTREQLALGASQIKLMAGGGVSSFFDPLDVAQFSLEEIKAAVEAADNWGTYVAVHAYTPKAVRRSIEAGVKCIEHGNLLDDGTARLMADKGTWWCLQPFLDDQDATPFPQNSENRRKQLAMFAGTDVAYELARKHKIRTAWGTDTLFDAKLATRQGAQLAKLKRWYRPWEILKMATSENAALLELSGLRAPYQGKLGVVREQALADLLLIDGDPLADIGVIETPDKSLLTIMKDGNIYKNSLS
jgi:imidazolonepropionase-like amidohydrolase